MLAADDQIIRNLVVIVARKADYLKALFASLDFNLRRLQPEEERLVRGELIRIVSEMKPTVFVSRTERVNCRLSPATRLEDLDRESLARELERELRGA